jgi:hypothetical protein
MERTISTFNLFKPKKAYSTTGVKKTNPINKHSNIKKKA